MRRSMRGAWRSRREEASAAREHERRERAIAKAQEALEEAEQEHNARAAAIETERSAVEARGQAEDERWAKQKAKLTAALRLTRDD